MVDIRLYYKDNMKYHYWLINAWPDVAVINEILDVVISNDEIKCAWIHSS